MDAFTHHRILAGCVRGVVALLLILGSTTGALAESVYKCRDASGHVAYQDHACANPAQETRIEIAPAARLAASPDHAAGADAHPIHRRPGTQRVAIRRGHEDAMSYECRAADGEVFYTHSGCPKTISVVAAHERGRHAAARRGAGARGTETSSVAVSARPLARSEVCKRLAGAGSIGRVGHKHDETVSTYDRNVGRDPCRR